MKRVLLIILMCSFSSLLQAAEGNAEAAKGKISMCMGCHGIPRYQMGYPKVYKVPKIGGQNPQYIVKALQAYKTGARAGETMPAIAANLSDQDMLDIAAYYGFSN